MWRGKYVCRSLTLPTRDSGVKHNIKKILLKSVEKDSTNQINKLKHNDNIKRLHALTLNLRVFTVIES